MPLCTMCGTASRHLGQRGEGGEDGGRCAEAGLDLHRDLGRDGESALGADEQLGQVVPARALDELAARAQHLAIGQHHFESEHVMAGHAVANGPHAAGVGGHVPAERAALLARGDGVDEAERRELAVELLERHARLHDGDLVLGIDLADALHAVEGQQDAVGHRDRRPGKTGAAATGNDRHPVFARQLQDLGDLVGRPGQHHGEGDHRHGGESLVMGVVRVDGHAGDDMVFADGLAQLFQQLRHRTVTPTSGRSDRTTLPVAARGIPSFTFL